MGVTIHAPRVTERWHAWVRYQARPLFRVWQAAVSEPLYHRPKRARARAAYAAQKSCSPHRIKIETHTDCNLRCMFCPVPGRPDSLRGRCMSWEMFRTIVDELRDMAFAGTINLSLNNEPLLDDRLEEMIAHLRRALPHNNPVVIITNGVLLTPERVESLFAAGLTKMIIDNYDDSYRLHPHLEAIATRYADKPYTIDIWLRRAHDILNSEGGYLAVNPGPARPLRQFCYYPFYEMCIGYNGSVLVCCHDVMYDSCAGRVGEASLPAIWNGKMMQQFRRALLADERGVMPCARCDYVGYSAARVPRACPCGSTKAVHA